MSELSNRLSLPAPVSQRSHVTKVLPKMFVKRFRQPDLDSLAEVIQLIAICVRGGLGYLEALQWVAAKTSGFMREELDSMMQFVRVGDSPALSLMQYESASQLAAFRELALKLALADQLGSPVADQLEELAQSLSASKRAQLSAIGAAKENQILLPLIFVVLPITVLFAIYPSMQFLQFSTI